MGSGMIARRWLPLLAGLLFAAAATAPAGAATRLHFKNGHSIVVTSAEEQGNNIVVTLQDGSTLTFPKVLIAEQESGPNIRPRRSGMAVGTGRGPSARELKGYQRILRQAQQQGGKVIAQGGTGPDNGPAAVFGGSGAGGQADVQGRIPVTAGRRKGAKPGTSARKPVLTPTPAETGEPH